MASGSGKNQEGTEAKEPADSLRLREDAEEEESNAADSAAAAATEPPPPAPPSESFQEGAHGSPEAGAGSRRDPSRATAAAAERTGEETMASAPAGGKPSLPPRPTSVSTAWGPSSASGKAPLPPSPTSRDREEVVASGLAEKAQAKTSKDKYRKSEAEEMPRKLKDQVKSWVKKVQKKPIWRKFLDRIGNSNGKHTIMNPHVNYQKVHMAHGWIIRHYNLPEMVAGQGVEFHSHVLNLCRAYSEFRPVHGDVESFYRSFIFSYLEQVLDRQDTHEEHRLLAAVKGVARHHARLVWASEFSRSQKAFKKLIKKVMRWKTRRGWKRVPTINSYRTEKLLEFFSCYDKTNEIFTFLRLVAATWICSHSEEFEPLIPELNEGYTLTNWCFREVIQRKVFTDHIQITALVRALGVPLRVEYLFQEVDQDLYIGQISEDDISICTCLARHHHALPLAHQVPRVTVLYSDEHYDVIYPYCADGRVLSTDVRSGQQSDKVDCPTAAKSPSQYQGASCSNEKSSQKIDWIDQNSTGEESNHQLPLPDELLYGVDGQVLSTDVRSSQQSDMVECPTAAKSPIQYQGGSCSDEKSSQKIGWIDQNSTGEESNHQLPLPDELLYGADGRVLSTNVRSSQQSDKVDCPTAAKSPCQYEGGSCSDENSSQKIDWIDQNSSGEESNHQLPLPDELLWDIFLQLPPGDIHQSLSICKQFRNLIRQERFQHQHAQIWSLRILIYHKPDAEAEVPIYDQAEVPIYDQLPHFIEGFNVTTREVSPLLDLTCFPYPFDDPMGIRIHGSCDGMMLLSFEQELCVWNPWTGWWGHLAPIHLENVIIAFYAHSQSPDESAKEYLILCRTNVQDTQGSYWIINLGKAGFNAAREIGRPMIPGSPLQLDTVLQGLPAACDGPPTVINGFLVWLLPPHFQVNYLITFNTMMEVFGVMDIPDTNGLLPYQLLKVENRIAIAFLSEAMDSIDVWELLNNKDGWVSVHNVDLPIDEIQAMRGIDRFGEPIIYVVLETLDMLIWTPEFLMVVDPSGLVLEYHQHHPDWIMLPPHILKVRFEEQFFSHHEDVVAPFSEDLMPPFFRFPEIVNPARFTQSTPESGMDGLVSRLANSERSSQQTVQGGKLSSHLTGRV